MKSKITITLPMAMLTLALASFSCAALAIAQNQYSSPTTSDTAATKNAATGQASSISVKDKTFMKKAAKGGMMEVAMGKLAEQNGQSEDVKSFGKRMVTDHSKANDELKSIAAQKNVKLPGKEPSEKWTSDKQYIDAMVKDHEKDLAEFQEEANTGTDPDVKKFAEETAKVVQEHLDLAKETQGKLK
jgi:putative membrane protein